MASATKMRGEQYTALLELVREELDKKDLLFHDPGPFGMCFAGHEDLSKPAVAFVCGYAKGFMMPTNAIKFQTDQLVVIVEVLETLSGEFPQWSRDRLSKLKKSLT